MYCSAEAVELQLIESIFDDFDPEVVSLLVGRKTTATTGSDTLTVCVEPCANILREASAVIVRDEVFTRG
jgi:hypothetical protein